MNSKTKNSGGLHSVLKPSSKHTKSNPLLQKEPARGVKRGHRTQARNSPTNDTNKFHQIRNELLESKLALRKEKTQYLKQENERLRHLLSHSDKPSRYLFEQVNQLVATHESNYRLQQAFGTHSPEEIQHLLNEAKFSKALSIALEVLQTLAERPAAERSGYTTEVSPDTAELIEGLDKYSYELSSLIDFAKQARSRIN